MRIKSYSTGQFAGLKNKSIEFSEGMNVISGDNEAGKSTIIAGIYSTLFQSVNAKKSSTGYKNFVGLYKPSGSELSDGVYIDGKAFLSFGSKDVIVEKTWLSEPEVKVWVDGIRYRSKGAEELLERLLKYGNSFYDNIVFGRQNNESLVLSWLFADNDDEGKQSIRRRLSEYASVVGGVDIDRLGRMLDDRLSELGSRWDFELNQPVKDRGRPKDINDRWKNNVGLILADYYSWKDALQRFEAAADREAEQKKLESELAQYEERQHKIREELAYIADNKADFRNLQMNRELLKKVELELAAMQEVFETWPELKAESEELHGLAAAYANKAAMDRRSELEQRLKQIKTLKHSLSDLEADRHSADAVEKALDEARKLDGELRAAEKYIKQIRLTAHIMPESGNKVYVESAYGNSEITTEENCTLDGYAKFLVPGIVGIEVDVEGGAVRDNLSVMERSRERLREIYSEYGVNDTDELALYCRNCRKRQQQRQKIEDEIALRLDGTSIQELERECASYVVDEHTGINADFEKRIEWYRKKYRVSGPDAAMAVADNRIADYENQYKDMDTLAHSIICKKKEAEIYSSQLSELSGLNASGDPYFREEKLKSELEDVEECVKRLILDKSRIEAEMDSTDTEELKEEAETAHDKYLSTLKRYNIYMRIRNDLVKTRSSMVDRPADRLGSRLETYLGDITAQSVGLRSMGDNLSLSLSSSGNMLLSHRLLSEGTKSALLLAYKLAVLDFFFQDEGGMLVLDDVLLDMDPARRDRAAALLRQFALNNQVIFTTCDPEIARLLGGRVINV